MHAEVHRAAHEPVGTALDEPLRRRPRRGSASALEREPGSRLDHERTTDEQEDDPEDAQRERLRVRVPARQEPGDDPGHDHRPAEKDEADASRDDAEPGARRG